MRTNIYGSHVKIYNEEQTGRVEPCAESANDGSAIFKGIRFFFGRQAEHSDGDDDSSAVTFYFTDEDNGYWKNLLKRAFGEAIRLLDDECAFAKHIDSAKIIAEAIKAK